MNVSQTLEPEEIERVRHYLMSISNSTTTCLPVRALDRSNKPLFLLFSCNFIVAIIYT